MNIHPLFVHFPIALLSLYTFFEVFRFKKLYEGGKIFYIKATLVIAGVIMALPTLQTGDSASHLLPRSGRTIFLRLHENFAQLTTFVFGILALGYAIVYLGEKLQNKNFVFKPELMRLGHFILRPSIAITLSIVGFILLSLVGALGGIMVYGGNADPLTHFLFTLLNS